MSSSSISSSITTSHKKQPIKAITKNDSQLSYSKSISNSYPFIFGYSNAIANNNDDADGGVI